MLNKGDNEVSYFSCADFQGKSLEEPILLPDGTGADFTIPITLSDYPEGTTVGALNQPVLICATMEHSYLGDLDIWLQCPDGTKLGLHDFRSDDEVRRQLLGEGVEGTETPDPAYQYCWRSDAPYTFEQYIITFSVGNNESMPAGDYAPEDPVSVIENCLVNGEWSLRIRDNIAQDNGSLTSWYIAFPGTDGVRCDYTVEVKSDEGGTSTADTYAASAVSVSPNPFQHTLRVTTDFDNPPGDAVLSVVSARGREITRRDIVMPTGEQTFAVDAAGWPAGIYFLRIHTEEGEWVRKVVRR